MKYDFRALNTEGAVVTGSLDVDTEREAARQLRRQGLTPVGVQAREAQVRAKAGGRKPKTRDLLLTMHQLATLLRSGVSLDEAVSSLASSTQQPFLARELDEIGARIRRGEAFSGALKASRLSLPPYMHHLAEAGELTGALASALRDGVSQMEYEQQITTELRNALIYPSILVISGIGAVLLIFTIVVPKFSKLLEKAQGDVHWLARAVLETGQAMNDNMLLVGLVIGGAVIGGITAFSRPEARQALWDAMTRVPVLGEWLIEADIGRWAAMLSTLLTSRVELTRALGLAQQGVTGSRLRAKFSQVTKGVRGGGALADALKETDAITPTGYGLIRVGERSGELPAMLRSLAEIYTESGRNRMKRFLTLLEPAAILLIASVIGVIMTGIILAITSVNDIAI